MWIMARDLPELALLFCAFGLFAWFLLMRTKARLKAAGMDHGWTDETAMFFTSFAISIPLALTLSPFVGVMGPLIQLGIAFATVLILRSGGWGR